MDCEAYIEASITVLQMLWDIVISNCSSINPIWRKARIMALEALNYFEVSVIYLMSSICSDLPCNYGLRILFDFFLTYPLIDTLFKKVFQIERSIPNFRDKVCSLLIHEIDIHVLQVIEKLERKVINYEHRFVNA